MRFVLEPHGLCTPAMRARRPGRRRAARRNHAACARPLRRPRHAVPGLCGRGEGPRQGREGSPRRARRRHRRVAAHAEAGRARRRAGRHADRLALARPPRRARDDAVGRRTARRGPRRGARPAHRLRHRPVLHRSERAGAAGPAGGRGPAVHRECVSRRRPRPRAAKESPDGAPGRRRSRVASARARSCRSTSHRATKAARRPWSTR